MIASNGVGWLVACDDSSEMLRKYYFFGLPFCDGFNGYASVSPSCGEIILKLRLNVVPSFVCLYLFSKLPQIFWIST